MTEYDDNYNEVEDDANLVKDLRRQIRSLQKENGQLSTELDTYKTETRTKAVQDILSKYGVNEKMAKVIPADVEGEDSIKEFLSDLGVISSDQAETTVSTSDTPNIDPTVAEETKKQQTLSSNAVNPSMQLDFERRLEQAKSPQEVQDLLKEFGNNLL